VYIVDGDTPVVGEKNLREFWEKNVAHGQQLIVNTVAAPTTSGTTPRSSTSPTASTRAPRHR
jgi:bifunctional N-acetylglucosamine-1-phosphate-uridyltransferase/glucosamine-1-phosphate-acetyltransferase GlmU-like protein